MFKKIIAFLCVVVMLLPCVVSCKKKLGDTDESKEATAKSGEILISDLENYTIVYSKSCSESVAKKANVLAAKLYAVYGVTVEAGNDERYQVG